MLSVFLSHTHADKPFARRLAERLKAHGVKVWLDEAEMQVGDSLFSKIESAVRECTYLGVILSPRSVSSPWVQREVNMALTEEIHGTRVKVLPLLQEKCRIPGFLTDKLYADFTDDFNSGLSVLLQRLDSDLHEESYRQKRAYEILQSGYQDWVAFSKQDNHLLDPPTVDLVVGHVSEPSLSMNLLEFLFTSISFSSALESSSPKLQQLRKWIGPDSPQLLDRLLQHPSPEVRIGSLTLFGLLGDTNVSDRVLRAIREEKHTDVRRTALRAARTLGVMLPESLALELLESVSDWVVQSYARRGSRDVRACLLVSDGTEFAAEIGAMARDAGFQVVTVTSSLDSSELDNFQADLMRAYSFVALGACRNNDF
ncbi:MAG: toll/interleukin-1 receptor domain-containing protein [Syntrophobacteraceae bacterium]